ncbi:MAG: molybdopterin molybdotransferase MoeA [Saprospiraceae bacterium]|nr:molybdopterin molybdotransferase MoeA [Saprospiraceae bacterium]
MITVEQATQIILENAQYTEGVNVPLMQSLGRILREDIVADRDFPPFDRVTMDGIALDFAAFESGQRAFRIENVQAAGKPQLTLQNSENCIEVMTGAMLPMGTDVVVRYEDVKIRDGVATIAIDYLGFRQNIHHKGIDRTQGDVILQKGIKISAAEIATLATVGKTQVKVSAVPKVAIVSTGDELVEVSDVPLPYQIRRSNVFAVSSLLREQFGIEAELYHFVDDESAIRKGLQTILIDSDVVILSGAVSEGKYDFVPKVLAELQVEKLFHKVSQRPGKPFWFGRTERSVIFALPGNPVSAFMCACRYILPFVRQQLATNSVLDMSARLATDIVFKPDLTYFLPVKIQNTEGGLLALPSEGHGSGDLANLNEADGFLELPKNKTVFKAGEVFSLFLYR